MSKAIVVSLLGPNLYSSESRAHGEAFHVHSIDCGDLQRYYRSERLAAEVTSITCQLQVANLVYGSESGSFYEEAGGDAKYGEHGLLKYLEECLSDFWIAPCVKLPLVDSEWAASLFAPSLASDEIPVAIQGALDYLEQARDLVYNVYRNPEFPERIDKIENEDIRNVLYGLNTTAHLLKLAAYRRSL